MTLKYLAWDVGIKNLAYSIIEYNLDNKEKTIIDWGVINLMNAVGAIEEDKKGLLCSESNNIGKKCTSRATFLFQNDNARGLCGLHKNMKKYKTETFIDLSTELKCCYEIVKKKENTQTKCIKKATFSKIDNLSVCYCNQHLKIIQKKEPIKVIELKKTKKINVKGQSILDLSKSLYQHLDNLKDIMLNVDEVIIENQPVLKNPTMKTIQILLYSYFVMNGILKNTIKDIAFFSASKKLEAFRDNNNSFFNSVSHLSGQYQINKKLSILFTLEMIKNNKKWFDFFNKHTKKDDLADAYLTNCYYIDKKYNINLEPIKNKIKKDILLDKEIITIDNTTTNITTTDNSINNKDTIKNNLNKPRVIKKTNKEAIKETETKEDIKEDIKEEIKEKTKEKPKNKKKDKSKELDDLEKNIKEKFNIGFNPKTNKEINIEENEKNKNQLPLFILNKMKNKSNSSSNQVKSINNNNNNNTNNNNTNNTNNTNEVKKKYNYFQKNNKFNYFKKNAYK